MSVLAVRAAIAEHYRALLPGVTVLEHGGAMSQAELQRWTAKPPAVIVACLGWPKVDVEGGMAVANAAWAMFLVTRSAPGSLRGDETLTLAELVSSELPMQRWGGLASKMPTSMGVTNLYSTEIDKMGVNLWAVRWSQAVDLLEVTTSSLSDFLRLYTTFDPAAPADSSVVPLVGEQNLEAAT